MINFENLMDLSCVCSLSCGFIVDTVVEKNRSVVVLSTYNWQPCVGLEAIAMIE